MSSVLVHIYQRDDVDKSQPHPDIFGRVEGIDDDSSRPFTSKEELWAILLRNLNPSSENDDYSKNNSIYE